ncbi:MAG: hypothetical protein KDK39_16350, partial [Leptospiraceae bacterium]|nr:hypothetical protein [Leptospiraceae bacterium]
MRNTADSTRRAVITGIGVVSPIGIGRSQFWSALQTSQSGMTRISLFDASDFPCQVAAEIQDFQPTDYMTPRAAKSVSRSTQFGIAAWQLALQDSGLDPYDARNSNVIMGTAIDSHESINQEIARHPALLQKYEMVDPLLVQKVFIGGPASAVAAQAGCEGYVSTVSTACTSGINAMGQALRHIQTGQSRIVIAGAAEAPITRLIVMGFCSSGFFIDEKDDPLNCLKPFDKGRRKCAPGEGSVVFIVEDAAYATARGARVYCEIEDFAQQNENKAMFLPDKSGKIWAETIARVAGGQKVDHINAHGISDQLRDKIESMAIETALQRKA